MAPTLNQAIVSGDNAIKKFCTATYPFNQSGQAHEWGGIGQCLHSARCIASAELFPWLQRSDGWAAGRQTTRC